LQEGQACARLQDWLELAEISEGPVFRTINRHAQIRDREARG
jgi:hypothetical protein